MKTVELIHILEGYEGRIHTDDVELEVGGYGVMIVGSVKHIRFEDGKVILSTEEP